jgi:hypothetical protein
LRARLLWGWLGWQCNSHPVCGVCYYSGSCHDKCNRFLRGAWRIPLEFGTGPVTRAEIDWNRGIVPLGLALDGDDFQRTASSSSGLSSRVPPSLWS